MLHRLRGFVADVSAGFGIWLIRNTNPWKDRELAWRLRDLANDYDPSPPRGDATKGAPAAKASLTAREDTPGR